ncbi:MAG: DUF748 domain-containing protein [Methylophilus sp.]|nr:DUF748 domain-containing protein [Methylophilus sp.]
MISKPSKIFAGIFTLYLLFSYFAIDPLAKKLLPWFAENKLASHMTVGQVKFDPFSLILRVDHLRLTKLDGSPLAGFDHLMVNAETAGIFDYAWRLKDIQLIKPQLTVQVAPDGKLNWADLLAKLNEDEQEDSGMTRLKIDHLLIEGGNIQYAERNRPTPFKAELTPLGLELEGLSTLPKDRGEYAISAKLPEQGATMKWKGDFALNPLASNGVVEAQGLKLAKLMPVFSRQSLPLQVSSGDVQTKFNYHFSMVQQAIEPYPQLKLSNLKLAVANVAGSLNSQSTLRLASAEIQLPALDFSMQKSAQLSFNGLAMQAHQLSLVQGEVTLFKLGQAAIQGVDFDLAAQRLNVADVNLQAGEINVNRNQNGSVNWQSLLTNSAQENQPKVQTESTTSTFNFDIANVQLAHWQAVVTDQTFKHPLHAEVKDIAVDFKVSQNEGNLRVANLNSTLSGFSVTSALYPQPLATLKSLSLQNGEVSLKEQSVNIPNLVFSELHTPVVREANQQLNWQAALEQAKPAIAKDAQKSASPSWKVALNQLRLEKGNVHVEDKTLIQPLSLDVENVAVVLRNVSLDLSKPIPVNAKLQVKQGGQLDINGKVAMAPFKSDLQLKLAALSLKPFSPYVNQYALLKLDDGEVNVQGKLSLKSAQVFTSQFNGGFSINHLAINEEESGTPFLGWKEVSSDTLKLEIGQNQLQMESLSIVEPVGKFIIFEDKSLNVKRILRTQQPSNSTPQAAQTDVKTSEPASDNANFAVNIARVSIANGNLEFADLSLKPQFGTHVNTLSGVINGLSNDANATAQVELDGKVDDYGSARIRGAIQPFHATDFTDLKLAFHNLEMNRLTPYSGKFAGRKIDSGKLSVDLEYKIKQRQLTGENKFIINQIKLGERVDSPDAASLPLDLAIALLEDSDGVIDLDLPISGSLDDPQFSYGKIVWKAIVNVIGKIATAPFRLLGKLFGGSSDKLEAILFEPGNATVAPEEQEKLRSLAMALSKRPSLALTVLPTFDTIADKAAIQEQVTRREVLTEMGVKLKEDEQAGPIDIGNVKAQIAIENLLKDRKGEKRGLKALETVKNSFRKAKPEEAALYTKMLVELQTTATVSDADLTALAKARAVAIQRHLIEQGQLAASRVNVGDITKTANNAKSVEMKMSLGVVK